MLSFIGWSNSDILYLPSLILPKVAASITITSSFLQEASNVSVKQYSLISEKRGCNNLMTLKSIRCKHILRYAYVGKHFIIHNTKNVKTIKQSKKKLVDKNRNKILTESSIEKLHCILLTSKFFSVKDTHACDKCHVFFFNVTEHWPLNRW